MNATVEDPGKVDEYCQTNITSYKTENVGTVDLGKLKESKLNDTAISWIDIFSRTRALLFCKNTEEENDLCYTVCVRVSEEQCCHLKYWRQGKDSFGKY